MKIDKSILQLNLKTTNKKDTQYVFTISIHLDIIIL